MTFDLGRFSQRLVNAGYSEEEARAIAFALGEELVSDSDREERLQLYKHELDKSLLILIELHKGRFSYALSAMKSLILANGGAIVGVLTFLGHLATESAEQAQNLAASLRVPMYLFVSGLVCGLSCSMFAYLSQHEYLSDRHTWGSVFYWLALIAGIAGLVLFSFGALVAMSGFQLS